MPRSAAVERGTSLAVHLPTSAMACASMRGLFVIPDAAAEIAYFGHETHLLNRRLVGAGPWKHVADLGDLAFRLLCRGVKVRAVYLAGGVLESPDIRAQKLFCIVA